MPYQVMTFQPNGQPTPIENKKWGTKKEANDRMKKLESVYEQSLLFVKEVE